MDFIFMLTKADRTVEDCLDVLEEILPVGLTHIGFKDVGVPKDVLAALAAKIRKAGATSYMEVVSTSTEDCLRSAKVAVEIGIDRLLGGTDVSSILEIAAGSSTTVFPFPGTPFDHPTKLRGSPEQVESDCRALMAAGCGGCDLLAYRAVDAAPIDLVRAARRGLGSGILICAGSVRSADQIGALKDAGCDAFTIGSAAFSGSFSPHKGALRSQLKDILQACAS